MVLTVISLVKVILIQLRMILVNTVLKNMELNTKKKL